MLALGMVCLLGWLRRNACGVNYGLGNGTLNLILSLSHFLTTTVPGNPGLSSYYIPFLQTLHSSPALRGKLEILAVSHRGHAPVPPGTHSFFGPNDEAAKAAARGTGTDLDDQIAHKISVLDAVRAIYPREEDRDQEERGEGEEDVQVVLCGHSVGAYMSLEVMRARPGQVDGLHLLFPTLSWIGRTPNGTKLQVSTFLPTLVACEVEYMLSKPVKT